MKYKVLIVEDDIALSKGISLALKCKDYDIFIADTLNGAIKVINEYEIDLIILDINLPDGSGLDLLSRVRKQSQVPIIMLSANDTESDIVTGLELGANDYVTKPFSLMILRARVNAQLRNSNFSGKAIIIDDFQFDFESMEYKKGNIVIELSKTEQKLLKVLIENKGNVLERDQLMDKIWTDGCDFVDENALSVTVKRLRDKLEENSSKPKYIKTIYGIGYSWVVK